MTTPLPAQTPWQASLSLPFLLPTPNRVMRLHWASRGKMTRSLASEVWLAMQQAKLRAPAVPLPFATVIVERHSSTEPDPDALRGCAKLLLDVLQPPSKRHPYGLGIIANDDSKSIDLTVLHVKAKRGMGRTVLVITSAAALPTAAAGDAAA